MLKTEVPFSRGMEIGEDTILTTAMASRSKTDSSKNALEEGKA